ncbi:glycosyltransferase [Halomonas sp. LR5S13]|uniref:glycosyltransferase n=1 Tax=Halomonas rhizosphaerae TaxID=3043296 RepID=UPI0024A9E7A7|nr:glycosyltransferase [Halomonas rhizosphaerae]MDI5921862.1 glycosyltransferase [Halomonas rhizosphaerae]
MNKLPLLISTPKTYNGGAEHVAARLSRHFQANYDVSVISFDSSRTDYDYAGSMVDLKLPSRPGLFHRLYVILKATREIRRYKKKLRPVACISLIGHPNIANVLSRQGELCIVSVRTYLRRSPSPIKHYLQKKVINVIYNRADKIVAICEGVRKDLVDYYGVDPNKVEVIYPYFDVEEIRIKSQVSIEPEWEDLFSKPVIITAGRVTYDKGQWHLIKAFSLIKKELPDAVLVILGRGEMEAEMKELAQLTGYASDIHFLGYRDNPFKYIRASRVFAFPSLIEGFGNALGEALACGTPVVAADCDVGPREILASDANPHDKANTVEEHPAGFLIPAFDDICDLGSVDPTVSEQYMATALLSILQDNALRESMAKAAEQRACHFNTTAVTGKWDALVQSR